MASRKPRSYQLALRHSPASIPAQPANVRLAKASKRGIFILPRTAAARAYSGGKLLLGTAGFDSRGSREVAMYTRHALHFALGREALIETFLPELPRHLGPGAEPLFPSGDPAGLGLGVIAREVGAYPHHRLDGHGLGDHVVVLAPHRVAAHRARRLEEIADDRVVAWHLLGAAASELDRAPASTYPAVQLVEELCLQHPLVALAAPAEPIDAVAQRAVALAVEPLDQAGSELAVRRGERHVLVQIDQVALVDARRRRVDDDEHLGGEILAATVEQDAGHADVRRIVRALVQVELQRGEPVLAVDDQVLGRGLVERARAAALAARTEAQSLGGE